MTQVKEQLGIEVEKWVITGDSAGGHLSVSVAFVAMLRGFRLPDGIFSHYPVYVLDLMRFTPSMLMSIDEEVVNAAFLNFSRACFGRKGGNADRSCIMSPLLAPNSMLLALPPV